MPIAEINGYRMHHEVFGDENAPTLALVHGGLGGGDGSKDTINRQAAALSSRYRCVFYDRRSCGQSDSPEDGYDMPNCARDLAGLLAHLGIDRAHILGSSAGGPIATQFALDYPGMTESLILVNTMSYSQEAQREVRRQELRRLKERVAAEGRTAAVERGLSDRFPGMESDDPARFARIVQDNIGRLDGIAATHQAYIDIDDSLEKPALRAADARHHNPRRCRFPHSGGVRPQPARRHPALAVARHSGRRARADDQRRRRTNPGNHPGFPSTGARGGSLTTTNGTNGSGGRTLTSRLASPNNGRCDSPGNTGNMGHTGNKRGQKECTPSESTISPCPPPTPND